MVDQTHSLQLLELYVDHIFLIFRSHTHTQVIQSSEISMISKIQKLTRLYKHISQNSQRNFALSLQGTYFEALLH